MSKDITTTNQEKINQIEKYLTRNPEQKINDKGLYRISIKHPYSNRKEDQYLIEGCRLVEWLRQQTDGSTTYLYDNAGEVTHISYYVGNSDYSENERIQPIDIDEDLTLYDIAIEYMADDDQLDIEEVPEALTIINNWETTIIFDKELGCFGKPDSYDITCHISIEDVVSEIASDKESATTIYDKCKRIIDSVKLGTFSREALEIELEEAAEYIEEYY